MFTFNHMKTLGVFSSCSCERKAYYAATRHNTTDPGLHHSVVLHPGLICHHRQGGSLI